MPHGTTAERHLRPVLPRGCSATPATFSCQPKRIGQITDLIDSRAVSLADEAPERKLGWIVKSLEVSCSAYPKSAGRNFSLLYGGRQGSGMTCVFFAFVVEFKDGIAAPPMGLAIPQSSGPLTYEDGQQRFAFGSGRDGFKEHWDKWRMSEVGGTSRSVFSAFADHLKSGVDPYTGGPPQLVGIYRVGPAKTFGTIWNRRKFLSGRAYNKGVCTSPTTVSA